MLGEDPNDEIKPDDQGRAFNQKPLWQRYIIVLAGPAFNLIFPIIIYFFFFAGHTHLAPPVVGRAILGRPAAEAGLLPGDLIVSIDGEDVRYWDTMKGLIADRSGEALRFTIERDGKRFDRFITPQQRLTTNRLNMLEREGQIGISPFFDLAQIGTSRADSPAARAGLRDRRSDHLDQRQGRRALGSGGEDPRAQPRPVAAPDLPAPQQLGQLVDGPARAGAARHGGGPGRARRQGAHGLRHRHPLGRVLRALRGAGQPRGQDRHEARRPGHRLRRQARDQTGT